jgi:hypothetical protein
MANPVPFRVTIKGKQVGPWKAIVGGKLEELASENATKEEAAKALDTILESMPKSKSTLFSKPNMGQTKPQPDSGLESSTDSLPVEKPKTGEIRSNGLASLSPPKIAKFREQIAGAMASGNVSLDRALISIFRDKVPVIPPDQYLMLATGWELACEQFFVNGLPPWWIVVLLGNATVLAKLYESSEPKPEPQPEGITDAATKAAANG